MNSIQEFVAALNAKFADSYGFEAEPGRKFTRIAQTPKLGGGRSVYCFVQNDTLDVLKAEGWKKPARGIRANVRTVDVNRIDPYGSWLYRR